MASTTVLFDEPNTRSMSTFQFFRTNTSACSSNSSIGTKLNSTFLLVESEIVSRLEAVAMASVLEDCIDQLHILGFTNNKPPREAVLDYSTLHHRFATRNRNNTIMDVEKGILMKHSIEQQGLDKLQRDRAFCEKTLELTRDDLLIQGTFTSLLQVLSQEMWTRDEEDKLLKDEEEHSAKVQLMHDKIKDERVKLQDTVHQRNKTIAKLRDSLEGNLRKSQMELSYNAAWERTRKEQSETRFTMKEVELQEEIDAINYSIEEEMRVHEEISTFIRQTQLEYEDKVEMWMDKYDYESDTKDLQLNSLRQKRTENLEQFQQLSIVYEEHKKEIEEYLAICAEKERIAEYELYIAKMATRIQAWWRGQMVRHFLGPYRKKKKDKKGVKEKKGGKK